MQTPSDNKTVLTISSHVIRGAVGNRVSVHTLEDAGCPVWSMPTVAMTWQPRHGMAHKLVTPDDIFTKWVEDILRSPWRGEIDAVLTGYFGSPAQAAMTAELIAQLQAEKSELIVMCDPIIGDENGLYVSSDIAQAIRDKLLPVATLIKPNRDELAWFCGQDLKNNHDVIAAVRKISPAIALVSSAFCENPEETGILLVTRDEAWLAEHKRFDTPVNGLGDLTSAMFLVHYMNGEALPQALQKTAATVYDHLHYSLSIGADELRLADAPLSILKPSPAARLQRVA
ncbi:MAG: Pyridoxal kinase [Candidatus Tokpelaia hoelldobleri]|uniref:pyridoxal kinase n=1 Tax=Candidatus Tokpelaia hoelldobleri TaxID=1902579 RepID=A0A1U9JSI4_9HYPH|nr:MAG: Pyridoxal kinase [Candidatus Tokpelaia hoelldoblerii]